MENVVLSASFFSISRISQFFVWEFRSKLNSLSFSQTSIRFQFNFFYQIICLISFSFFLLFSFADLSRAQRQLAKSLAEFNFECIGSTQTDDEQVIVDSLKQFSKLIFNIEEERETMVSIFWRLSFRIRWFFDNHNDISPEPLTDVVEFRLTLERNELGC